MDTARTPVSRLGSFLLIGTTIKREKRRTIEDYQQVIFEADPRSLTRRDPKGYYNMLDRARFNDDEQHDVVRFLEEKLDLISTVEGEFPGLGDEEFKDERGGVKQWSDFLANRRPAAFTAVVNTYQNPPSLSIVKPLSREIGTYIVL